MIQRRAEQEYHACRNKIGIHHPHKTHSARQYGNNFGIVRHFRSEKYNGNKHKQGTECIYIERNNSQIKIEHNLAQGRVFGNKVVDMLADIEYDDYYNNDSQHQEICPYKFSDYVQVYFFQVLIIRCFTRPA
jgi:hypothetical protein